MWIAAWCLGAVLGFAGKRVDLPLAALTFEAPEALVRITPRAPALYEGILLRRTVERAHLSVFVVPCAKDAPVDEVIAMVRRVAGGSDHRLNVRMTAANGQLSADFLVGPSRRLLRVTRAADRHILFDFWGTKTDVDALLPAFEAAVLSVTSSPTPVAGAEGPWIDDPQFGIRLRLPFERDVDDDSEPVAGSIAASRPPLFTGLGAEWSVTPQRTDLDLPLRDAALALRDRTLAAASELTASEPREEAAGAFPALRIDYRGSDGAEAIDWLVDLPRHRLLITASASSDTMRNFRPAFVAAIASLTPRARQLAPTPATARSLGEHGVSFQMPDRLVRSRRVQGDELIAFVEDYAKAPGARVAVRLVDLLDPGDDPALRLQSTLLARLARIEGLVLDAPRVVVRSLNGKSAVSASVDVELGTFTRRETRVLIAHEAGAVEFAFECDAAERDLFDACRESILLSLTFGKATAAPELAPLVTDARCGIALRPPVGYSRVIDDERRIRFAENDALVGAFVEAAIIDRPQPNRFVRNFAELCRQSMDRRLTDEGLTMVRSELDPLTTTSRQVADPWFSAAYSKDGRPWRELRHVVAHDDRLVELRFAAPADRFRELRQLAESSLRTLVK
jgi:hypothetical protein